jgi:hypothetical protein
VAVSEIDPKTVREIAREIILDCGRNADDIGTYVYVRVGADLSKHEHGAWCSAIREAIRTAQIAVSWPNEQQPAEATGGEQARDGGPSRPLIERLPPEDAERVAALIDERDCWRKEVLDLRAAVAERDALAARVAELEGEREADTRAVDRLLLPGSDKVTEYFAAMDALKARFADRIAALNNNAKASEKRTPEEWCSQYGVDIADPDGWRHPDAPAWDEPITLADFYDRARQSTARNVPSVDWSHIARDTRES